MSAFRQGVLDEIGVASQRAPKYRYSLKRFPLPCLPMKQPNNYSCGPTAVAMVVTAIDPKARPSVTDLILKSGCNPKTGTTEIEMGKALSAARLRWWRGAARSLEALDETLLANRYVLLRTLVGGSKHWVVVDGGWREGTYNIACPTMGRVAWRPADLLRRWEARDFDHFVVPGLPAVHRPAHPPIHAQRFGEFIQHAEYVAPGMERPWEINSIAAAESALRKASINPIFELPVARPPYRFFRIPLNPRPGADAFEGHNTGRLAMTLADGTLVGGIVGGVPVVFPPFQGRGAGTLLLRTALEDGPYRYLSPTSLSDLGLRTRVAAHRDAILEAQANGIAVAADVIASNPALSSTGYLPRARATGPRPAGSYAAVQQSQPSQPSLPGL